RRAELSTLTKPSGASATKTAGHNGRESRNAIPLVALVGPPNAGKSTLFNQLTGLRQKVANYPGVTVEKKLGHAKLPDNTEVTVIDLPGVNGFSARSLDEKITRDVLEGRSPGLPAPDALVMIVDSTRLETQLMLIEPVLSLGIPTLLVLNMMDELAQRGGSVDDAALAEQLGVQVVRANARAGVGVDDVRRFLMTFTRDAAPKRPQRRFQPQERRVELPVVDVFVTRRGRMKVIGQHARFRAPLPSRITERLDSIFLHKWLGPFVVLLIGALVFQAIFTW